MEGCHLHAPNLTNNDKYNTTNLENGWKLEKEKEKQKTIAIPPLKKHPNNP